MASNGIKDRVAIVGMGCTQFGEHWDKGPDDLLIEAAYDAYESAGIDPKDVDAYWLGTMGQLSGLTLSVPLKIPYKPVTHVENFCATGSEALRQACYAVASGAYDVAMAIGVEKLKDSGFSGLVVSDPPNDGTLGSMTAPASFSLLAPAYFKKYGLDPDKGKDVLSRIAWKNHRNGAKNPKAQFRKEVPIEHDQELAEGRRPARHHGLLRRLRRLGGGDRRPRRGRAEVHASIRSSSRRCRSSPGPARARSRRTTTSRPSARSSRRRRTPTTRPASPTRARRSAWPRCTTASRRPSSSSTRISASARAAPRGRT